MVRTFKILNIVFFLAMITINALANIIPFGYGNTGTISRKYPNLFTPSPVTFSIWGVIYLLLSLFIIFQSGMFGNEIPAHNFVQIVGPWFIITCIMNIGWIFSWHYDVTWLSFVFIVGLLISLIILTSRLYPNSIWYARNMPPMHFLAKVSIITFDIYLGWICAATIANASALLVKLEWTRFGLSEEFWTVVAIIIGALLGVFFIITREKYMSAAAIIWAFCGIMIKHISQEGYAGRYPLIIAVLVVSIVAILSTSIIRIITTN